MCSTASVRGHAAWDITRDRRYLGLEVDEIGLLLPDRVVPGAVSVRNALIDQRSVHDVVRERVSARFTVATNVTNVAGTVEILVGARQGCTYSVHVKFEGTRLIAGIQGCIDGFGFRCQVIPVIKQGLQCRCWSERGSRQVA